MLRILAAALAAVTVAAAVVFWPFGGDDTPACVPVRSGVTGDGISQHEIDELRALYERYGLDPDRFVGNYQVQNYAGRTYLRWMGDTKGELPRKVANAKVRGYTGVHDNAHGTAGSLPLGHRG